MCAQLFSFWPGVIYALGHPLAASSLSFWMYAFTFLGSILCMQCCCACLACRWYKEGEMLSPFKLFSFEPEVMTLHFILLPIYTIGAFSVCKHITCSHISMAITVSQSCCIRATFSSFVLTCPQKRLLRF